MTEELERLMSAVPRPWATSGHKVFVENGEQIARFEGEIDAELAVAAVNALPALLRLAKAAQAVDAAYDAYGKCVRTDIPAFARQLDEAKAEWSAALAAITEDRPA